MALLARYLCTVEHRCPGRYNLLLEGREVRPDGDNQARSSPGLGENDGIPNCAWPSVDIGFGDRGTVRRSGCHRTYPIRPARALKKTGAETGKLGRRCHAGEITARPYDQG